jgi:hypothetical protein
MLPLTLRLAATGDRMKTYEITFAAPNGDWHYWRIEAADFHAAVENAMQSAAHRPNDRLFGVEEVEAKLEIIAGVFVDEEHQVTVPALDADAKYVFATGNVKDGFDFIGPFDSHDEAIAYAENHRYESWDIILLSAKQD